MEKISGTTSVFFRFYILCENFSKIELIIHTITLGTNSSKISFTPKATDFYKTKFSVIYVKGTLGLANKEIAECAFFGIIISWDGVNLWRKFLGFGLIRTP